MWYLRDRMVRRRTIAWTLVIGATAGSVASRARSQSVSLEEAQPLPPPTSTPAPLTSAAPPRPVIVMPEALETPLEYPSGAQGEAAVALELTLTPQGRVTRAVALEGDEPFASVAAEAAQRWTFRPATRGGEPVAAKIRFLVRFVPPREAPEERAPPETSVTPAAPSKPLEIVVIGERPPIRHELARAEISRMPGAFGDAFRAIEALPGVVPIVSGLPYFYVRGAPPGNVGYFFDGIPVPFLYHFAAGPSLFHPAFIDRVDLYPGAYPVRYGRFAGAVVAGEMAPPGYRTRGEWNVRLIDSGAMLEAPFAGGRGSAMVGGRFSYTGLVLSLVVPDVSVGYWDYQARVRYDLGPKDSVEIFGFGSGDYTTYKERSSQFENGMSREVERKRTAVDINFHRLDLRWDRRVDQGNWRNALFVGRDRTGVDDGQVNVYDYLLGARSEYWKQLAPDKRLRAGGDLLFESLKQELTGDSRSGVSESGSEPETDAERFGFASRRDFTLGAYADVIWRAAPRVQITPGLRADLFASGKRVAVGVDPRITAEFQLTQKLKATHGLALVHQAPSFIGPVPGLKSSLAGGLQRAVQHSVTLSYDLPAGFQSSVAVFHSAFFNMTDVISVAQLASTANTDDDDLDVFRTGGQAYGFELMVRRSLSRRLGGFITYTLSRSRRFTGRLSGPATTDRTHVLNVAASYDLGKNWRLGGRVLFYTGIPAQVAYLEAARHPPRTPPFWRLDFKLEKRWYIQKPNRWWGLTLEVLNTTLNKEQLTGSCNAYDCKFEELGPVTVPSIACEGAF